MIEIAALGTFARAWWKAAVGAAVMFAPAFMLGQCSGAEAERERQQAAQARAAVKATEQARAADAALAARRSASDAAIRADRKEIDNAVSKIPDGPLSARQRARALAELCRTGRAPAGTACGPVRAPGAAGDAR